MEELQIAEKLFKEGTINEQAHQKISASVSNRLFSIGLELKSILYIGILTLSGGLGVLVYKNIDSIGHLAVLTFIALVSAGCFAYCYLKRLPYSNQKTTSPYRLADYILLLGCLTFATFMGYLQYEFSAFGPHHEIAFLIPAIIFFTVAYFFDHIGILSMAITAFASFVGITITPLQLLSSNDFSSHRLIFTGLGLGVLYIVSALILERKKIKQHFTFTYLNFATHLLFISCIAGFAVFNAWIIFIALTGVFSLVVIRYAFKEKSFYFLFVGIMYAYIGASCLFIRTMMAMNLHDDGAIMFVFTYFIASAVFVVVQLRKSYKKLKPNDSI